MRGFTTVRDMGGPSFALKRAIDEGLVIGPRIYPSGAMITITGGHGDFRQPFEMPRVIGGPLSRMEQIGGSMIADSPDEVRVRVREQLLLGASQIKLTAGGGVASPHSPLDVSTFTEAELRAAVEAADNWGTYVAVHAYTPAAIQRAIAAGVKVIEHGHLMDEPTAKLMAEKGIWLSFQPFIDDGRASARWRRPICCGCCRSSPAPTNRRAGEEVQAQDGLRHRHPVLGGRRGEAGRELVKMTRWYTPAEVLTMATGINAELLRLSGPRNPYPGKLGVVEEGALADLLLVDGNPVENIKLIENPDKNFVVIMKDGTIYKNTLPR